MTRIYTLLLMSVSGTIMYLLSIIFGKKAKHYVWQYAMLVTAVAMLLVPIQKIAGIPKLFTLTVPKTLNIADMSAASDIIQPSFSVSDIITAVWLIGVFVFAVRMICRYIKTSRLLKQITEECYSDKILDVYFDICKSMSIHRNIILRSSKYLNSPLLFGIFKPAVIIPDKEFSEKELAMIMMHELTHYRHRDLWIALAASAAVCVHWFNPAVYFINKSITEIRELFCDEMVVKRLKPADKKSYGNLILSVIEKELNSKLAYTTSMASAKNSIQKRLRKIAEFKMPTKISVICGIMTLFACLVSSLTAFGFETAAEVIPEEIRQIIPIAAPTAQLAAEPTTAPFAEPEINISAEVDIPDISEEKTKYTEDETRSDLTETSDENNAVEQVDSIFVKETVIPYENDAVEQSDIIPVGESVISYEGYPVEQAEINPVEKPITSYVFNAEFSESTDIASDSFYAKNGTKLSINKVSGSKDVSVSVHSAETGEVIYDERVDKTRDNLLMTLPEDGEYYVAAHSENGETAGIYIYGE